MFLDIRALSYLSLTGKAKCFNKLSETALIWNMKFSTSSIHGVETKGSLSYIFQSMTAYITIKITKKLSFLKDIEFLVFLRI